MRSPLDALVLAASIACAPAACVAAASAPAGATIPAAGTDVTPGEIRAAVEKLRADPLLGREKKIRTLRWTSAVFQPPQKPTPWIVGLFEYLGQTARVLLWVTGTIAAALAVIWIGRILGQRRLPVVARAAASPSDRIGEMDIRAESLPDDIGAAALALAEAGQTRAALSLLYRGALSRVVHRFSVPIGESFTEGEALRAVALRLEAERADYFLALVEFRRRAVYAGAPVEKEPLHRLCRGFGAALDALPP